MANAHSHAFQRDLRGIAERPHPRRRLLELADRDVPRSPSSLTPPRCARSASASTGDGSRRLRRRRRVPLRPSPARRDAVRRSRTRWRSRSPRRPWRAGSRSCCCRPPITAAARRRDARRRASGASATRTSRPSWRASTRCARGRTAARECQRRRRRAQRPRGTGRLDRSGRARTRDRARTSSATCTRPSSGVSSRECARRARLLADRAARPLRFPRPPDERRPRDPRQRSRHRAAGRAAARSSSPARPPRATSATATCPALRYRDAGRAAGDRHRLAGPHRPVRGAARDGDARPTRGPDARFALLAAADGDLWGQTVANGRASLGLEGPASEIGLDLTAPELAGVSAQDIPLALATCASRAVVRR